MRKLAIAFIILAVSGCFGGYSPQSKFYSLTPEAAPAEPFASGRLTIGVAAVQIPPYLNKPQMVTREDNQVEISVSEFNRWSEPLSAMVQQALASDLAGWLPQAEVKPSGFSHIGFDYIIKAEITKFDGIFGNQASLNAWYSIFNRNGALLRRNEVKLSVPLGKNYDDLARQDSVLVNRLAGEIAAQIVSLKK